MTDQERRQTVTLSSEQVTDIATEAAKIAVQMMQAELYQQVGKTFVSKSLQLLGIIVVGIAVWMQSKGMFTNG